MKTKPRCAVIASSALIGEDNNWSARYWLGDTAAIERRINAREEKLKKLTDDLKTMLAKRHDHGTESGKMKRQAAVRDKIFSRIRKLRALKLDNQRDHKRIQEEARRVRKLQTKHKDKFTVVE